jgi:N-acetylglucosaminyl-diphospho-decaprenol L-rhamnosyltransferase
MCDVSVVSVLYNSGETIEGCMRSLPDDVEVILVDNASTDDGGARALRARPDARLVRSERNLGFGGGCNLGWPVARRQYVAFINPDVRLEPDSLDVLVGRLARVRHGVVGPALLDESGVARRANRRPSALGDAVSLLPSAERWATPLGLYGKLEPLDPVHAAGGPVAHVEGACFVVRRADLEAIGGFDEDLFLYCEECSLAIRLAQLGGKAIYEPAAVVEHIGSDSTRRIGSAATRNYYRSRVLLYRKRDGNPRGLLAAAVLALGGLVSLPVAALSSLLGRGGYRLGYSWSLLRGVGAGAVAVQRTHLPYRRAPGPPR